MLDHAKETLGGKQRGATLAKLLECAGTRPLWLVTNPDTLYLLLTARYALSAQVWARLEPCKALVLDEFHLYRGPMLVRAIALIELAGTLLGVDRVRVLSATLPDGVRRLLEDRLSFQRVVAASSASGRIVQHETMLEVAACEGSEATSELTSRIVRELPMLRSERDPSGTRIPMVVIRQSVLATIELEDELARQGVDHGEIGVYRGLSSKAIRSMDNKTLVLGTSALEVGVDFHTTRLLFEARSFSSFAQRLGRVARHAPGAATFVTSARVAGALERLGASCERRDLLDLTSSVLEAEDGLADDFVLSSWGFAVWSAVLDALRARGDQLGAGDALARCVEEVRGSLESKIGGFARPPFMTRKALLVLRDAVGFRGGSGSVEVFDAREWRRRGDSKLAVYELDLPLFLQRATTIDASGPRPTVVGYGAARRLRLELNMTGVVDVGIHAPTPEQLELRVDGSATRWECLLRERPHIVGIFPESLRGDLSWREDVFDSTDGRIALLDDDAIIAAFAHERRGGVSRRAIGAG